LNYYNTHCFLEKIGRYFQYEILILRACSNFQEFFQKVKPHKREIERAYEMKMEKRKREMQKGLSKLSNNLTNLIFCNLQSFSTGYKNNFVYNLNDVTRSILLFKKISFFSKKYIIFIS